MDIGSQENSDKKKEPDFKFNLPFIISIVIGFIISWINMLLIDAAPSSIEVLALLSIVLTTMAPAVLIGLKNRYWAYGYLIGFSVAGIPFLVFVDLFIGGYTFATSLFIFIILWLIFWKTWRSISKIKLTQERDNG